MLEDVDAGKIDMVVTHTIDRLSRNLLVTLNILQAFSKRGVSYVSITQAIDYSTPEGRLFLAMLAALAQYFSDLLSMHTRKGLRERAMQGIQNGEPPFGYARCTPNCFRIDEQHPGVHVELDKAAQVVESFQRYTTGTVPFVVLAERLNSQGFRTNSKRPVRLFGEVIETEGRQFTHWSMRDMLKNAFYAGWVRHKDQLFKGRHKAIISQGLFDQAQEQMKNNRSRNLSVGGVTCRHAHLLEGLLHCHECGSVLWSQNQGAKGGSYYKPPDRGLDLRCAYQGRSFPAYSFDAQVDELFGGFELEDDWVEWVMDHYMEESDLETALRKTRSIQGKLERAEGLYLQGEMDDPKFFRIKAKAAAEMASIYVPDFDDGEEALAILKDFGTLWQGVSVGRRNRLLKLLINAMYVDLGKRRIIALQPKETFLAPVSTMAEKTGINVIDIFRNSGGLTRLQSHLSGL